jgi:hypothetical protein
MKKTILCSAMFLGALVFAQKTPVLGGDKDAHGCIGSAGYTYSQIRKDCVRLLKKNQIKRGCFKRRLYRSCYFQ